MHVAVYGAGALGSVYGVRLATRAEVTITFVVRPARASASDPIVIERVRRVGDRREQLTTPVRSAVIPGDADAILLAVGTEDLEAIRPVLDGSSVPILVLTPMLPLDWARMREAFRERVLAAMPNVISYARADGVVRYWLAPTPTRFDEPRSGTKGETVRTLAERLTEAGLTTHLELGVHETNPATTVCMIPIGMAVALAGSLSELARNAPLLDLTSRACAEGVELARSIGRPELGAVLGPYLARPLAMRAITAALKRVSPEVLHYLDEHFGRKLRAQHRMMAAEMATLARSRNVPHEAIDILASRLA